MSRFFIERPIFAIVIALLIMLAGGLSIIGLPIEQVPPIAPPTVQISTTYPGASAQTVENTVVQGGLDEGERVIVAGVQKVQTGMTVRAVEAPIKTASAQ